MRPITISPCQACARIIEHCQDPTTVLCRSCEAQLHLLLKAIKPPPEPPKVRKSLQVYRVFDLVFVLAFGFLLGWIARGGS